MTVLQNKQVYIANSTTPIITDIEAVLQSQAADCVRKDVSALENKDFTDNHVDVLILDFVEARDESMKLLQSLQKNDITKTVAVFAVVPELSAGLPEEVYEHGAADFVSSADSPNEAIQKIKSVLGEETSTKISSAHTIDITPHKAPVATNNTKVFFVEDDALLHNLLQSKFEQSGFTCTFSTDGKKAVGDITSFQPDVIVLDIMLPGISGLDILGQLKSLPETKQIPVIMFSNRDEQADRKLAEKYGAEGFYVKAMTELSDLVTIVQKLAA